MAVLHAFIIFSKAYCCILASWFSRSLMFMAFQAILLHEVQSSSLRCDKLLEFLTRHSKHPRTRMITPTIANTESCLFFFEGWNICPPGSADDTSPAKGKEGRHLPSQMASPLRRKSPATIGAGNKEYQGGII